MTSKQYLSRAYNLRRRIAAKQAHLEELRVQAENTSPNLTGMPKGNTTESSVERFAIALADLAWEIELDRLDLALYETQIKKTIDAVEDPLCFQVLTFRYLAFHTWTQIADEMHYSASHIYRLHAKALHIVDEIV